MTIGKYNANCRYTTCNNFATHEAVWDDANRTQFITGELMHNPWLQVRKQCAYANMYANWETKAQVVSDVCSATYEVACVTQCESGNGKQYR